MKSIPHFLSALLAVMLTASAAYAQGNVSTINQAGGDHQATVTQTNPNADGVSSSVTQNGSDHTATQTQTIEDRFDGPVQLNATIHQQTGGNTAIQVQTYDASLPGGMMEAEITQSGVGNEARQVQIGGVSVFASVFQEGGEYGPNHSFQEQTGHDLSSIVSQIGHMNLSVITQTGANHTAVVTQNGSNNTATITQSN